MTDIRLTSTFSHTLFFFFFVVMLYSKNVTTSISTKIAVNLWEATAKSWDFLTISICITAHYIIFLMCHISFLYPLFKASEERNSFLWWESCCCCVFSLNNVEIVLLLFYFYLLGSTAERFFCPVLGRISRALNLSPNVAVLLSFQFLLLSLEQPPPSSIYTCHSMFREWLFWRLETGLPISLLRLLL
jgi:hypothetical protein